MKDRFIRCQCGRNISEHDIHESQTELTVFAWCRSCHTRSYLTACTFKSNTRSNLHLLNPIDWQQGATQ